MGATMCADRCKSETVCNGARSDQGINAGNINKDDTSDVSNNLDGNADQVQCSMTGTQWSNNMKCTGAAFEIPLPVGQRTAASCVRIAAAGQAGDPNRMCINAVGCGVKDSDQCRCTLHCGCAVGSAADAKSCIQKPVASSKTCGTATCAAETVDASAASEVVSTSRVILALIVGVAVYALM